MATERDLRGEHICERLARAFEATCRKHDLRGTCEAVTIRRDEKDYLIPAFSWSVPTSHLNGQYAKLVEAVALFIDGQTKEEDVRPLWQTYAAACLEPPTFVSTGYVFPERVVDESVPLLERKHQVMRYDQQGKELVMYCDPHPIDALDLMRWICGGNTHYKEHGAGEWKPLHMPSHRQIEAAREARGESSARKRMSAKQTDEDNGPRTKPSEPIAAQTSGMTIDELRCLRDEIKASKGKKGKRKR